MVRSKCISCRPSIWLAVCATPMITRPAPHTSAVCGTRRHPGTGSMALYRIRLRRCRASSMTTASGPTRSASITSRATIFSSMRSIRAPMCRAARLPRWPGSRNSPSPGKRASSRRCLMANCAPTSRYSRSPMKTCNLPTPVLRFRFHLRFSRFQLWLSAQNRLPGRGASNWS